MLADFARHDRGKLLLPSWVTRHAISMKVNGSRNYELDLRIAVLHPGGILWI